MLKFVVVGEKFKPVGVVAKLAGGMVWLVDCREMEEPGARGSGAVFKYVGWQRTFRGLRGSEKNRL